MMTLRMKLVAVILLALFVGFQAAPACAADAISVNIPAADGNSTVGLTDTAGVVPFAGWNDVANGATGVALHDSNNVATGLTFSAEAAYSGPIGTGATFANPGDQHMMFGTIYVAGGNEVFTFSGTVPYSTFDLYVYSHAKDAPANIQTYTVRDLLGNVLGSQTIFESTDYAATASSYILTNNQLYPASNDANYGVISLTASQVAGGFTVTATPGDGVTPSWGTWVNGFQIVETVPEPSTLALLVGGLFGLMAYAWKKRK